MFLFCRREEFMHWVEMLPDTQTPSWLGLPSNAEKVLLTTQGAVIYPLCLSDYHVYSISTVDIISVHTAVKMASLWAVKKKRDHKI